MVAGYLCPAVGRGIGVALAVDLADGVGVVGKSSFDAVAAVAESMHSGGLGTEDSRTCSAAFALEAAHTCGHVAHDLAMKPPMLENWIVEYDIQSVDMGGQPP